LRVTGDSGTSYSPKAGGTRTRYLPENRALYPNEVTAIYDTANPEGGNKRCGRFISKEGIRNYATPKPCEGNKRRRSVVR
jgi:hypothetical protein